MTNALFSTTTEVYPDSKVTPVSSEQCNQAQVAAIKGGLDYIIANVLNKEAEGCAPPGAGGC